MARTASPMGIRAFFSATSAVTSPSTDLLRSLATCASVLPLSSCVRSAASVIPRNFAAASSP